METIAARDLKLCRCNKVMKSIKVFEYSRSRSFDDDLILQGKALGECSQDLWSSGFSPELNIFVVPKWPIPTQGVKRTKLNVNLYVY